MVIVIEMDNFSLVVDYIHKAHRIRGVVFSIDRFPDVILESHADPISPSL